jgi:ABC-type multidrug transport system fused ATPase/permease subunit
MILLLGAYYSRDVIFTRSLASITSNVPAFMESVDMNKLLITLLPYVVAMILFYISNILYSESLPNVQLDSVSELVNKIMHSIKISKKEINMNDLLIHIKSFAESGQFYRVLVANVIPTIIVVIGVIYNMVMADIKYGLIIGIILIMLILVTTKLEYDNIIATRESEKSMNGLFDEVYEILTNIDTIITANTEEVEKKSLENIKKDVYMLSKTSRINTTNTTQYMQIGAFTITLMINYFSYLLYVDKYIDTTTLIANMMMSILFMDNYTKMLTSIASVMGNTGAYFDLMKYFGQYSLHDTRELLSEKHKKDLQIIHGDIELRNINLTRKNNKVFENLNLMFRRNTITGIIGPIGSGKSSLMKMIAGIIDYQGDIMIDEQNIRDCNNISVMKHIIYIPQHPILFNRTLYDNIMYGTTHTKESTISILKSLDLISFFDSFPQNLDTIAGKGGNNLSGGQKQMIALIRSLLQNKKIILLDEPSSSLDILNRKIFMNLVSRLKDKTIIINTHDKNLYPLFDQIIDLAEIKSG